MPAREDLPSNADAALALLDSRARALRRRRNTFRVHPVPTTKMGSIPKGWIMDTVFRDDMPLDFEPTLKAVPDDLAPFVEWFSNETDARERFRWALRDSLDELLDGQRTGRWAYQHLSKTEKTYLGTAVEVNLTKEFEFPNGQHLDWSINDIDIDCKFSKDLGGWEIPMEMYLCDDHGGRQGKANHPALLTWMNDDESQWAAGLVTITDDRLRWRTDKDTGELVRAYNRDNKRRLDDRSANHIHWLWGGIQADLPRNLLLHLDPAARRRIFSFEKSGQRRVDQLFREVRDRIVGRQVVLTVAQQDDAPKRARDARLHLRNEGIVVLGHEVAHAAVATRLALPAPVKGEWIATRIVPVSESDRRPYAVIDEQRWARAEPDEPVTPAPVLSRSAA